MIVELLHFNNLVAEWDRLKTTLRLFLHVKVVYYFTWITFYKLKSQSILSQNIPLVNFIPFLFIPMFVLDVYSFSTSLLLNCMLHSFLALKSAFSIPLRSSSPLCMPVHPLMMYLLHPLRTKLPSSKPLISYR